MATIDDIAHELTDGYWNGDAHHFDVSVTRAITVNLTGIDAQGLAVARQALALWTDIIGVAFVEVTTGGQIVFGQADEGTGAFSTAEWAGGITSSATVNVAPSRLSLHTYMHEIAHALGLGHAGDYNGGTAFSRFPYEAMFLNDGAAVSIMSYFDNAESSYYAGLGFTNSVVVTPQLADIIAMGNLYGLSTTTRTGDTTYGFNNSSGRDIFNAATQSGRVLHRLRFRRHRHARLFRLRGQPAHQPQCRRPFRTSAGSPAMSASRAAWSSRMRSAAPATTC